MDSRDIGKLFPEAILASLFPAQRADLFFDVLLGDAAEGSYDIKLSYEGHQAGTLAFRFELRRRPEKCLACHLTYGLPDVFARHPVIDVGGLVQRINDILGGSMTVSGWRLNETREISKDLHVIPLLIEIKKAG